MVIHRLFPHRRILLHCQRVAHGSLAQIQRRATQCREQGGRIACAHHEKTNLDQSLGVLGAWPASSVWTPSPTLSLRAPHQLLACERWRWPRLRAMGANKGLVSRAVWHHVETSTIFQIRNLRLRHYRGGKTQLIVSCNILHLLGLNE